MKRYLLNLRKPGKSSIEITEAGYLRISTNLLREDTTRIVVHEKLEHGERTHYLVPGEIASLDEIDDDFFPNTTSIDDEI